MNTKIDKGNLGGLCHYQISRLATGERHGTSFWWNNNELLGDTTRQAIRTYRLGSHHGVDIDFNYYK